MYYPVIVHKDENSDYGGIVYDFKGCFTAGATVDELVANVQEAIECHTEGEEFDVPTPSDLLVKLLMNDTDNLSASLQKLNGITDMTQAEAMAMKRVIRSSGWCRAQTLCRSLSAVFLLPLLILFSIG
ncbi:type II toxin-antitoxin system HicB family antitoxin [Maridesulfovibrio sp.]|uniref:type II toxin-antitoxin system HicB family antitoxin n=1 Tax=Maridesulfovibrio sp. TaxID=2795000 RepID=UPI0029CA0CC3|nr:type II toxin-antitoxin system HicB family antitoxin [Maridesulfovibrio sp.]